MYSMSHTTKKDKRKEEEALALHEMPEIPLLFVFG